MKIFAYKTGSGSAKALAEALRVKRLKHKGGKWKPNQATTIVNWGATSIPHKFSQCHILNRPEHVANVSNKLKFFRTMEDNPYLIPEWADNIEDAEKLFKKKHDAVVCRNILTGHSGRGIIIATAPKSLVDCRLYVKYIKKKDEYRVHVIEGEVVDVQKKAKRRGVEIENYQVRNTDNGFVYIRNDINPPRSVTDVAVEVMLHTNLVFGAVDVIYNEHHDRAFALEVNTAPGLEGQTIETYANYFAQFK